MAQDDDLLDSLGAAELEPAQKTAKGVFFALMIFMSLVYLMLGIETSEYKSLILSETQALQKVASHDEFKGVTERAERWYTTIMVDTGGQNFLARIFNKRERFKSGLKYYTDRIGNNVPLIIYQGVFRLSSFGLWIFILLPFIVVSLLDAVNLWRAKIYGFGQMKIRKFHLWRKLMTYTMIGLSVFFLIPAIAGPNTIYFPPAILVITTYLITRLIKEYQVHL